MARVAERMTDEAKVLQFPAQWEAVSFPKNRANCGKFTIVTTQEIVNLDERDTFQHLAYRDEVGQFLYVPNGMDYSKVDIPTERAPEPGFKSKGQQLRSVIWVYWREVLGGKGDPELAYRNEMQYIIDSYKEQLAERVQ